MAEKLTAEKIQQALREQMEKARDILEDDDKSERFLQKLEQKIKVIPYVGDKLSNVPVLASLIRSYIKKDYRQIPQGSIVAIAGALLYLILPLDLIPDSIPLLGYADDVMVINTCWKLVKSDVDDYQKWRKQTGRIYDDVIVYETDAVIHEDETTEEK